jgi:hypothetical protein
VKRIPPNRVATANVRGSETAKTTQREDGGGKAREEL